MEQVFDDYKYKNINKKIKLKLNQKTEKTLSPWEISNFVGNFNTYYYQSEVINTISIALANGIKPENIIIFDQSFKLNYVHSKLFYLSMTDKDLENLYYIGNPISLFPSEEFYVLNLLFRFFRKINEFLYKVGNHKYLNPKDLHKYFNNYKNINFENLLESLQLDINKCLRKNLKKVEFENLEKIYQNLNAAYKRYKDDNDAIENIKEKLKNNKLEQVDFTDDIYKKYFKNFFYLIENIQRPVVAVKNDNDIVTILCRAQINKKQKNAVTLSLKSITHNSPIGAVFEGGATLYKTFKSEARENELHEYKKKQEDLKLEILEKKLKQEEISTDIKELERLEKAYEVLSKIAKAENFDKEDSIDKIPNPYLKQQMQHYKNKIVAKSTKLLDNNNFEVVLEESEVIEISNTKLDTYG